MTLLYNIAKYIDDTILSVQNKHMYDYGYFEFWGLPRNWHVNYALQKGYNTQYNTI